MAARQPTARQGFYRANRAGMMLIVMTLCQYAVPAIYYAILGACGADLTAASWGLPHSRFLFLYLSMYLITMILPTVIARRALMPRQKRRSPLNLSADRRLTVVLCGVALCLVANMIAACFSDMLFAAGVPQPELTVRGDGSFGALILELIVFAIVPAFFEEILLRGTVLETLRPLGDAAAVFTSAVLFGLMHGNLQQTPYALLMGLVLGFVFVYTDDLRLAVIIHAIANALSVITGFLLQFLPADEAYFWELCILIVTLMMGGVSALWLRRHPLSRTRIPPSEPLSARVRALLSAPLLWAAVLLMSVLLFVRIGT